jgi:hypothetical protein
LNYYGEGTFNGKLADGTQVTFNETTDYPLSGHVKIKIEPAKPRAFNLRLRIPGWSKMTTVRLNGAAAENVKAGCYLELKRRWKKGDTVELEFDMELRFVTGDREAAGKVSVYRGPLLLAYDQRDNDFDEGEIPALDLPRRREAKLVAADVNASKTLSSWLLLDVTGKDGRQLRLRDFASAGCNGTRYRSWLTAENAPPPPAVTRMPADSASITAVKSLFKWTTKTNSMLSEYRLVVSDTPDFSRSHIEIKGIKQNRFALDETEKRKLSPGRWYYWKVIARNKNGETESVQPAARFKVDASVSPAPEDLSGGNREGPGGVLVSASLRGSPTPEFGQLKRASDFQPATGPDNQRAHAVSLNGQAQMLIYDIEEFPDENYSMALWVKVTALPENRLGQIFSAWAVAQDDPLRVCVEKGKLFARIEAQQGFSTEGVAIETGRWHHVAAVKSGSQLTLYLNGQACGSVGVPAYINSTARSFALGGNPNYSSGNEFLTAEFAGFVFYNRAMTPEEINAPAARR